MKLLLVSAFTVARLTLPGAVGESLGIDRRRKSNTGKPRTHALFARQPSCWDPGQQVVPRLPCA